MTVTFERHTGRHCQTKELIDLGQCRIFVDDRHVGYVADHAGAPVCLLAEEPEAICQAIRDKLLVDRQRGPSMFSAPPPDLPADEVEETWADE